MPENQTDANVVVAGLNHDLLKKRSLVTLIWKDAADKRLVLDVPFGCALADLPAEAAKALHDFSAQIAAVPLGMPEGFEDVRPLRPPPEFLVADAGFVASDDRRGMPPVGAGPAIKLEADPNPMAMSVEEIRERVGQIVGPEGAAKAERDE